VPGATGAADPITDDVVILCVEVEVVSCITEPLIVVAWMVEEVVVSCIAVLMLVRVPKKLVKYRGI